MAKTENVENSHHAKAYKSKLCGIYLYPSSFSGLMPETRETPPREQWSSWADFIMSCIGYAIGLGNAEM
ncbi:unnamed protein product [Strongylus vulgaris]|uniref:Uncharacterized protein n=1 Tax=Strongylus vulgaris TaxID=40348 RepID=A0A3P7K8Y9_STRVU|nr:unnamed protein product [Strongylus vulgaris]